MTRKRYRKEADEDKPVRKKHYSKKREEEDEDEEEDRPRRKSRRGRDEDSPFVRISGMFESRKSRGTYTVFLKDQDGEPAELIEKLEDAIKEGKMLGITTRGKGDNASLWYIKDED